MTIAVRYYTRSGNTRKLAEAIADAVGVKAQDVSVPLEEKTDLVFLGSSLYAGGVDEAVKAFVAGNAKHIGQLVSFSTAAIAASAYKPVKQLAQQHGVSLAEQEFHCRGAFLMLHRSRPNQDDLRSAAAFARAIAEKK